MKNAPAEQWDAAIASLEQEVVESREAMRRQDYSLFKATLATMQADFNFCLVGTEADIERVARTWYAARRNFAQSAISVLDGVKTLDDLFPDITTGLPLAMLWGTRPTALPELWAKKKASIGVAADAKTLDKYRGIAEDLEAAIPGRPAESITHPDLENLKQLWLERGNKPPTISDKLSILQTMMRPLQNQNAIQQAFDAAKVAGFVKRAKRLPFTKEQVRIFVRAIMQDGKLPDDDKFLLLILLLTGARLEEICQLVGADISSNGTNWTLRLAFGEHTDTDAQLKNGASARQLTIPCGAIPMLDTWLSSRSAESGNIFPGLTPDKYGKLSGAVSKRLNRRLRQLVGQDRRIVLLSTRPTSGRVLRRANVDPRVRQRQLGHADVSIHDKHYDPAEFFDDEDLIPAAQVLAGWVLECLQGETQIDIDTGGVIENLLRFQLAADVSAKSVDAPAVKEHFTVQYEQSDTHRLTRLPSQSETLIIEALDRPYPCAANEDTKGSMADFQFEVEKSEVLLPSVRDKCIALELDVRHFEHTSDDELSRILHGSTSRGITKLGPTRRLHLERGKPVLTARELIESGFDIGPNFEAAEGPNTGQTLIQTDLTDARINIIEQFKPVDQTAKHAIIVKENTHARIITPKVGDILIPGIQQQIKDLNVVHGEHIEIEFAAPVQSFGNGRARLRVVPEFCPDIWGSDCEFDERGDPCSYDFMDEMVDGGVWDDHDCESFLVVNGGEYERETKVMDSLRQGLQRHLSIRSPNAGGSMSG